MQKKIKIVRVIIIILAILLTVSVLLLARTLLYNYFYPLVPTTVMVPDNLISPESGDMPTSQEIDLSSKASGSSDTDSQNISSDNNSKAASRADVLYLYNRNIDDNTPFQVTNMFPGDNETKYYCIRVSHKNNVTVRYHADIKEGSEKLAEVLKCRIVLLTSGEVLFDGLMRDMPESLKKTLTANASTTSELYYQITAYLDTSVGNDYQFKDLAANFRWWVEESENENLDYPQTSITETQVNGNESKPGGTGVKTGVIRIVFYAAVMFVSLFLMIILCKKMRREDANDE